MNIIRLFSQYSSLGFSALIMLVAGVQIIWNPRYRYSGVLWLIYGSLGTIYYLGVFFVHNFSGHDLSAVLRVAERTLVFFWLGLRNWDHFLDRWRTWTQSKRQSRRFS